MNLLPVNCLTKDEQNFSSNISHKDFVVRMESLLGGHNNLAATLEYFEKNAEDIKSQVRTNGVLLFRGFPIHSPKDYQTVLEVLKYDLYTTNYAGASPRSNITQKTFVSTEAPSPFIIGLHTEFCYQTTRPGMISFLCLQPAAGFGETPLFDCHAIWNSLSHPLRERLLSEGLLYKRYFRHKKSLINFHKTWGDTFQTDEKHIVEKFLESEGMTYQWDKDNNLATELKLPAMLQDPLSGKPCLSITMFNADAFVYNFRHFKDRYNVVLRKGLEWFVKREYSRPNAFLQVLHGSGEPFTAQENHEIQKAAWDNSIIFEWQAGDLLLIDNIRFGHARLNVRKPRRVIAAMANSYDVRELIAT
jgi:alpha-ketoglutarate-dependent taurine dioxygenase